MTLAKSAGKILDRRLRARGDFAGLLFVRLDKGAIEPIRLTARSVNLLVGQLGDKIGVQEGQARPHGLRHQAITAALDLCPDLRKVQSFSGHARLDTLQEYGDNCKDFAGGIGRLVAGDGED